MENATRPTNRNYLKASDLITAWAQEYRAYLLDGDPNILHPKAKAALVCAFAEALDDAQPVAPEPPAPAPKRRLAAKVAAAASGPVDG